MASASEASTDAAAQSPDARSYAEQRVYAQSPLGVWTTTALFYVLLAGAYAAAAALDHRALIVRGPDGPALERTAQVAAVLALIICAILALQRHSHLKMLEEQPVMARVLGPGQSWSPETLPVARLRLMTAVGVAVSLAASLLYLPRGGHFAVFAWFTAVSALLGALFFRGVVLTQMGSRHAVQIVSNLKIDLLRVDELYPWGRAAARTSLIWFTVSAATCLLFVGGVLTLYTILLLVSCALIGVWVFVGTLSLVHRRIRQAKAEALDGLRAEITALKARLHDDATASARLHALLAYEHRIDSAPEWPFDQTILVRLGASALILTVPWFGQAVAGLVVDHFGKAMQ